MGVALVLFGGFGGPMVRSTTKAQVSGHKFMQRRAEHGLVLGDIRMIDDPLARRCKAVIGGSVVCAVVGLGAVALAFFRPQHDPGDAMVFAHGGTTYVRVESVVHPVVNLTSAQLIAGEPVEPARASAQYISAASKGAPVGIADAPQRIFPSDDAAGLAWSACVSPDGTMGVEYGVAPQRMAEGWALLGVVPDGTQYVIDADGRVELPAPDSTEGRAIRRVLDTRGATPARLSPEFVATIPEKPPVVLPPGPWEIIEEQGSFWLDNPSGVQALTQTQVDVLVLLGAKVRQGRAPDSVRIADAEDRLVLPSQRYQWVDPDTTEVCATEGSFVSVRSDPQPAAAAVVGKAHADSFRAQIAGAVAVWTEAGLYAVTESGRVHLIEPEAAEALGVEGAQAQAPWPVLSLLPRGSTLSRQAALEFAS